MSGITTHSAGETEALGRSLARLLAPGDFIALCGDLGAGKTCFARGVAAGLDVDQSVYVTSPTYTLLNIYSGRLPLYHFDLYRLAGGEVAELGFEEYFYGDGVCLVEWAERLGLEMPEDRLVITFSHGDGENRRLELTPYGLRSEQIMQQFYVRLDLAKKKF